MAECSTCRRHVPREHAVKRPDLGAGTVFCRRHDPDAIVDRIIARTHGGDSGEPAALPTSTASVVHVGGDSGSTPDASMGE